MKIDITVEGDLGTVEEKSRWWEARGASGVWTAESQYDPFLPLGVAARCTDKVEIGTAIAVAFARSPMSTAYLAHQLHASTGRFVLGLGSQVRAHVTRRFSMPWSKPALRMREYIGALQAIWARWNNGDELSFTGDFYTHTLMPEYFCPPRSPHGAPKVYLAAVGEKMTQVAGEIADGFLAHPFSTERYLREVSLHALEVGASRAGRSLDGFTISAPGFVVTGRDESELRRASLAVRQRIAFYGSTPGYREVLDRHGWGELQGAANELLRVGRSDEIGELVDDEMLNAFAVVAEPTQLRAQIEKRYGGIANRVNLDAPYHVASDVWASVLDSAL